MPQMNGQATILHWVRAPVAAAAFIGAVAVGGCTNDPTLNRTGTGAAVGAVGGGLIGSLSGNAGWGALIGAGVGGAGGLLYDYDQRSRGY